jgi:hypothetical protein
MTVKWSALSYADRKELSLAVADPLDAEDNGMAAFYILASGDAQYVPHPRPLS